MGLQSGYIKNVLKRSELGDNKKFNNQCKVRVRFLLNNIWKI